MRRISLLLAAAALALAATGAATGGKPSHGCPPGFNLGAVSFEDYLELERTAAAINDGLVTEQDVLAALSHFDKNGNEVVCVQLSRGKIEGNNPFGEYFYNVVDDNASTPS
jgi:hypothetical protein